MSQTRPNDRQAADHTADDRTASIGTIGRRRLLRTGVATGIAAAGVHPVAGQETPYDGWFENTDNYNGTVDRTGEDSVTVTVGAGESGLAFSPAAIAIDPGTTVVWEWTGEGGGHNVVAENRAFESETVSEAGHTFEHTFGEDADGTIVRYVCVPHQALGMVGAIAVGETGIPVTDGGGESAAGDTSGGTAESTAGETGSESDATAGGLSSTGQLTMVGSIIGIALLSPVLFGLVLKLIYEDDRPPGVTDSSREQEFS